MDFLELAKKRFSVRSFKSTPVEEEKIAKILEAAKVAPTAKNTQPHKIYVVRDPKVLAGMNEASPCIYGAPLVFAIGYDTERTAKVAERRGYTFGEMDSGIVTTHMILEATDQGLGSCWVGMFIPEKVAEVLDLPENIKITALLPVGYPSDDCVPADRHTIYRPDEEIVTYL